MEITYTETPLPDREALLSLYENAGWTAYTRDPAALEMAMRKSLYVLQAKYAGQLVGLIRVVGDGLSIVYIQDILVHTDFKRKGIGTELIRRTLSEFASVRQKVLLTEDQAESRGFYESLGFKSCDQGTLMAFAKLGG